MHNHIYTPWKKINTLLEGGGIDPRGISIISGNSDIDKSSFAVQVAKNLSKDFYRTLCVITSKTVVPLYQKRCSNLLYPELYIARYKESAFDIYNKIKSMKDLPAFIVWDSIDDTFVPLYSHSDTNDIKIGTARQQDLLLDILEKLAFDHKIPVLAVLGGDSKNKLHGSSRIGYKAIDMFFLTSDKNNNSPFILFNVIKRTNHPTVIEDVILKRNNDGELEDYKPNIVWKRLSNNYKSEFGHALGGYWDKGKDTLTIGDVHVYFESNKQTKEHINTDVDSRKFQNPLIFGQTKLIDSKSSKEEQKKPSSSYIDQDLLSQVKRSIHMIQAAFMTQLPMYVKTSLPFTEHLHLSIIFAWLSLVTKQAKKDDCLLIGALDKKGSILPFEGEEWIPDIDLAIPKIGNFPTIKDLKENNIIQVRDVHELFRFFVGQAK